MATKEENYADLKEKCKSRWWRLNNLYYIKDKKGQKVKFKLNKAQKRLYNNLHYLNLILKARQMGFTTFIQILMLDAALFNSNLRCGVIAQTKEDASDFFREKIKYAYDNLPELIKERVFPTTDSTTELVLCNGSSIKVGTSLRSGTFQWLHISEFGKICAKFPEKAREIITGALNTIEAGQVVFIESTAEGQEGKFYEMSTRAEVKMIQKMKLTPLDFKFFFYAWWMDEQYRLDPEDIVITKEMQKYFQELLENEGIEVDDWQKAWYVKKEELQGDDMKREFPSTAKEAFEQSVEGSILIRQFQIIDKQKRICDVPHDPNLPVLTAWDIGRGDATAIWFYQVLGLTLYHMINYYEVVGMELPDHAKAIMKIKEDHGYHINKWYAPHDINVTEWGTGFNRVESGDKLGIFFQETPKLPKDQQMAAARSVLPMCKFDAVNTGLGVSRLRSWKKEWNDKAGVFKDNPKHDINSDGADAFIIFALNTSDPTNLNSLQNGLNNGNIDGSYDQFGQQGLQSNTEYGSIYDKT